MNIICGHQALTKQTAHSGDDGEKNKAGNLFITIQYIVSCTEFMFACMCPVKRFYCEADYNFYNHLALTPGLGDSSSSSSDTVQGSV